jgi:glutamate-1-semialdehyde aminotransferase
MTSAELYPQFRAVFPTGVSHDIRVTDLFPLVMAYGQGTRKWDMDGEQIHDLVLTLRRESSTLWPRV